MTTTPTFTFEYIPEKHDEVWNLDQVYTYTHVEIRGTFTNQRLEVGYLVKVDGVFRRFRYDRILEIKPEPLED